MKKVLSLPVILLMVLLISCTNSNSNLAVVVNNADELSQAIQDARPGAEIILANGTWNDLEIEFYGEGTAENPIMLRAETAGEVFIEGQSSLHIGGTYLIARDLYFRNGYSPNNSVIRFQIGKDSTAFHSQVTNCVIEDFTRPNRWENDRWVELYGQHNQFDHNYLSGKSNDGATLMVFHKGNQHTKNHHQIVNNYFGPRPRKGGPRAETIRLGGSETSMTPGLANVSNNYFEACNGEVEIISDKTNFNNFKNNIFYKCEGSLVMRHSDYTTVDGNMFIGDDDSDFYGGIRTINSGHWITNNYFYKIKGEEFRSPLAVMNGIPKSSLNRYKQVTDVVVAYNTWIDCKSPWQIGVGQNKASSGVLPKSEIRSAPPIRTTIANNIIYNSVTDAAPVVNHDDISGIRFENNVMDNNGDQTNAYNAFTPNAIAMEQINPWLFIPKATAEMGSVFNGFGFDRIQTDLFGKSRADNNAVGAIADLQAAQNYTLDKKQYGPSWYSTQKKEFTPTVHSVDSSADALQKAMASADDGDIIELTDKLYVVPASLNVDKAITLRSSEGNKATLSFRGEEGSPAFRMHPKGRLELNQIKLTGEGTQTAFAPLEINMRSSYKLFLDQSEIENFDHILIASKGSFADSIGIKKSVFRNLKNGFVLAADQKGDYNAEMVSIDSSEFINIDKNLIHFYRGGYDESTIGGFLTLTNNSFKSSGKKEKSGILLKTRGIINVLIEGNRFANNPVKRIAVLWGAKNNQHRNNTITNSGEIEVQEQQKLELLY